MGVFTGPGDYEIVPSIVPSQTLNSWEGQMQSGAVVKTYKVKLTKTSTARDQKPVSPISNSVWTLALVSGSGETAQYLISNARTGYFLTATAPNYIVSTPQISPSSTGCRWIITPATTNGYIVYTINCAVPALGQLNLQGASTDSGTPVLAYQTTDADNCKFYFDPVAVPDQ